MFTDAHRVPRFTIPHTWKRYIGLDFGGVNTAAVFIAEDPKTGKRYVYREYRLVVAGSRARQGAARRRRGHPGSGRWQQIRGTVAQRVPGRWAASTRA